MFRTKLFAAMLKMGVALASILSCTSSVAQEPTNGTTILSVRDTQFTLNDRPAFLLGISYYGALGAPEESIRQDLDDLQAHGFNWLRVWATWGAFDTDVSAVNARGEPRAPFLDKLQWLVEECDRRSMIVDVTLTRGRHSGKSLAGGDLPDFESHQRAVETITNALKQHRNWYLDLANERDVRDERYVPVDELKKLRDLVRRLDPQRLVTASFGGHDLSKRDVQDSLIDAGHDFLSIHRPRNAKSPGQTQARTREVLAITVELNRPAPVHHQEPFRRGYAGWEPVADDFLTDLRGAVAGGAAGWCFHNGSQRTTTDNHPRRSFDMREQRLLVQLDSEERIVLAKAQSVLAESQENDQSPREELRQRFGEQQFSPPDGFLLRQGQRLPALVWEQPELVAQVVTDITIPTRWFNDRFEEVTVAERPGRYYAYGEAPVPDGPVLRRAMTCCCLIDDLDATSLAEKWLRPDPTSTNHEPVREAIGELVKRWQSTEDGAVELAAWLETGQPIRSVRIGQWQMENATRHVRLKRKLMGFDQPPVEVQATPIDGEPAAVLRTGRLEEVQISDARVREIEGKLDEWYAASSEPMAIVIARNGVVVSAKAYGDVDNQQVTINTPMLLHSAMKPLIGLQLAMYVDRDILRLDEPIGNHLPDFNSPGDLNLTFRAGHVHATGIHFPWELAFSRLFYFHTWHESLIAHCRREWPPGNRHRYGVVGVILSVRALELLRGRNYWDAMERDLFQPLEIDDMLPGGTGFSAEDMARIGVLLANHGKYGKWQLFSEATYQQIIPVSLQPYLPDLKIKYGIGLQDKSGVLGSGSYGHGGGCGTQLIVNPDKHLVFAMVRNNPGPGYGEHLSAVTASLRAWIEE